MVKDSDPGLTAASALCQLSTVNGLPLMTSSVRMGSVESLLSVNASPVQRCDKAFTHADLYVNRHGFADI